MSRYSAIKAATNAYIKTNGRQEITGAILNAVMIATINALGKYYQFAGVADRDTDPGSPDENVIYITGTTGTYANFGGIVVNAGEMALLKWDGTWTKQVIKIIPESTSQLLNDSGFINNAVGNLLNYYLKSETYTKGQVDDLIAAVHQFEFVVADTLPTASADTMNKIYLIPAGDSEEDNYKDEYVTILEEGVYSWEKIGSTAVDLSDYPTNEQMAQAIDDAIASYISSITASVDSNVGTPSVDVSYSSGVLTLAFHNLKGVQGDQGVPGPPGVTSVEASVDNNTGIPSVEASVNAGVLTLTFHNLKGLQGDTGSSVAYPFTLVNNTTTDDPLQALTAAMGKYLQDQVTQLEAKVSEIVPVYVGATPVDGRIKYDDVNNKLEIEADSQTRDLTLDDVAYENLTYRQIFETNNALGISAGFEDGSFSPMIVGNGSPEITTDVVDSGDYSLKCFGSVSTQIKTASSWGTAYKRSMYIAMRVNCVRYTAGGLGFSLTGISLAKQAVTDGFETISTLATPTYGTSSNPYVGSYSSANLDGYIDTPVVVLMNIFSVPPSKVTMDSLYETYVLIKQGNAPTIVIGTTNLQVKLVDTRTFTDEDCKDAFMAEVNKVAQRIGATSSNFPDASGLTSENSYTTAQDLFRILVHASGVEKISEKWGKKAYSFNVYGTNARQVDITTSVQNTTYYDDETNPILGGKTGTLSLISPATYNLMFITTIEVAGFLTAHTLGGVDVTKPVNLAVAFLGSNSDANRWQDAQKLVDFITGIMNGQDTPSPAPNAKYVAVGLLPDNPITYDNYPFKFLYSKSSTTAGVPASCTKIISLITAYENMADENEIVEIKASDLIGGSGNNLQAGDFVRIKDLVYDMLLPSSNDAATALSRIIGEKILRSRTL